MNVVSILVASALAAGGSVAAAGHSSGTLRFPILQGRDAWWNDWRLLVGGLALLGAGFTDPRSGWRMAWGILGIGSLASYGATEALRMTVIKRASGGAAWGMQGALPGMATPQQLPAGAPGSSPANPIPAGAPPVAAPVMQGVGWAGW